MNEDCPGCRLDFDRGEPGHFTGAMYVSYALAIPLIALLTLIEHLILPSWSLFRLVVLASLLCLPLDPLVWQYSRVIWIYFDRYFDPEDDPPAEASPVDPAIPGNQAAGFESGTARRISENRHREGIARMSESQKSALRPITEVACELKIAPEHLEPYGRDKAKVRLEALHHAAKRSVPAGKLILVSAITPTPAGEGKTTTSIGLAQALCRIGKNAALRFTPAVDGAGLRPQGRRDRRRRQPGRAIEHDQPPVHRRLPRDHGRSQPARRRDRQPPAFSATPTSTRRESSGSAPRHERPRTAAYRDRTGGQHAGGPTRVGLRHHGGQRGHGHPLPGRFAGRPAVAARPDPRRLFGRADSLSSPRRSA